MKTNTFYNFRDDLKVADKTESEIASLLESKGMTLVERCHDNRYDLLMKKQDGSLVTFELKEDFTHARTGNIGVEFECRGKPSGVSVSKADYYIYKIHYNHYAPAVFIIKTSVLKSMIADKCYFRIVNGGDVNSNSMNYLFKDTEFYKYAKRIA